jgi:integrase
LAVGDRDGKHLSRHRRLWLKFKNEKGSWVCRPSGLKVGQEKKAKELLKRVENLVEVGGAVPGSGPLTVAKWSEMWLATRRRKGIMVADDYESRLKLHILPKIGHLRLDEVRVGHVAELVQSLRDKKLAPRTVRHIYFQCHGMFQKAIRRELLAANPCVLDEDDLPAKVDHDPEWRQTAIYSRDEIEQIIVDERIPWDRRMYDALLFPAGIRFGEASALRWRHYDSEIGPLGKLSIARSYSTKLKAEKEVKTKTPRDVPVHLVLAELLADWKKSGWPAMFGREPGPDDLIIPSRLGKNRSANHMLKKFHQDLERLGIRARRQHDLRRTFISLCLGDGGRSDILRWVTHSRPKAATIDDYTTLVWNPLCEEVAKLRIALRRAAPTSISPIAKSVKSALSATDQATGSATGSEFENDFALLRLRGGRDLNPRPPA